MKNSRRRISRETLESLFKRVSKAAVLAGGLLLSTPTGANPVEVKPARGTIEHRVKSVRAGLQRKLAEAHPAGDKLSYAERELAQWGNWGNWGNWNNWRNWNNWNNWGNWGNWRNY